MVLALCFVGLFLFLHDRGVLDNIFGELSYKKMERESRNSFATLFQHYEETQPYTNLLVLHYNDLSDYVFRQKIEDEDQEELEFRDSTFANFKKLYKKNGDRHQYDSMIKYLQI